MTVPSIQNPPTHRLLARLMRSLVLGDFDTACATFVSNDFRFTSAFDLLEQSRLSGYFYSLINSTEIENLIPAPLLEQLAASYQTQEQKSHNNLQLLVEIQRVLTGASIPFLSLKGLYVAERFFGGVNRRFMWDLDILVRPEDFQAAIAATEAIGLRPSSPSKFDPTNPFWGIHAVQVSGNGGYLDIHHAIRSLPKISFDHDAIWNNALEFHVGSAKFPTLCDTDTLLISAIGVGADIQNSHHNLRKIWDIYIMLLEMDATTDWQSFFSECEKQGSLKLVLNMFSFCLLLLDAKQDCPRLSQATSLVNQDLICITTTEQADRIFVRNRQHISNRILFSRLLPVSALHYWLDWVVTLPVRTWHHRHG